MTGRTLIGCMLALASAAAASAQTSQPAAAPVEMATMVAPSPARAQMRVAAVEARVITGRPYSAEATTEFVQVLGDGNKIVRKATARIHRDGEGRTRREELAADGTVKLVSIYDPVAHITYVLDPATRTARKSGVVVVMPRTMTTEDKQKIELRMMTEQQASGRMGSTVTIVKPEEFPAQAAPDEMRKRMAETVVATGRGRGVIPRTVRDDDVKNEESLGQKIFDGVLADGKRVTTVLPAGSIGNQLPITVVSEQWFAPDLEILVMTRHSDPRTGETSYSLSNITRGEPAAGLFDVPPDYTIQESGYMRTPASR